jgi:hypothetical protein
MHVSTFNSVVWTWQVHIFSWICPGLSVKENDEVDSFWLDALPLEDLSFDQFYLKTCQSWRYSYIPQDIPHSQALNLKSTRLAFQTQFGRRSMYGDNYHSTSRRSYIARLHPTILEPHNWLVFQGSGYAYLASMDMRHAPSSMETLMSSCSFPCSALGEVDQGHTISHENVM